MEKISCSVFPNYCLGGETDEKLYMSLSPKTSTRLSSNDRKIIKQMTKLPSNFELDRYGLHVRLVREEDAEFILSLRTNPKLSKYLHETDASVPKQREWIRQYKKRERAGEDYYLIFFYQNQPIGVIRIYHIDEIKKSAMAGSWVCSPNIPIHIPIYVLIICREIMFDNLHLEKDCFEVRKDNKQVQRLHIMMGAKIISVDEEKCYYELTREDFLREKESIIGILGC